ncbi:hypothetical protein J3E68DRAFT_44204 [Trichoderma sp. SZMC 28012]
MAFSVLFFHSEPVCCSKASVVCLRLPQRCCTPLFPACCQCCLVHQSNCRNFNTGKYFFVTSVTLFHVSSLPDRKFLVKRTSHVKPCTSTAVNKVQSHRCLLTSHTPQAPMLCSLPQHPRILTSFPGAPLVRPKWRIQPPELESYTPKTLCPAPSRYRLCFCGCIKGRFDDCRGTGTGTGFI